DDADVHPKRAFLVQGSVLLAVLPQAHLHLASLTRNRRSNRDSTVRSPKALQALQVHAQHHGLRPGGLLPLDDRTADPERAMDDEEDLARFRPDLHVVVFALRRDVEPWRRIIGTTRDNDLPEKQGTSKGLQSGSAAQHVGSPACSLRG